MSELTIRPLQPTDREAIVSMFDRLSAQSRYRRFFSLPPRLDGSLLHALVDVDHRDREAVVATVGNDVVGIANYARMRNDPRTVEVAIAVEDAWQRHGVGRRMMRRLGGMARARGAERVVATILADNGPALAFARSVDPEGERRLDGPEVAVVGRLAA